MAAAAATAPGTLYRIYKDGTDSGPHYTAVPIKDGRFYEVKNPDTRTKTTFDSLAAWCEARGSTTDAVRVTTKEAYKTIEQITAFETVDRGGFNVPCHKKNTGQLFQYYYNMIVAAAPHLLDKEEVKTAYNNLVGVCGKYIKHINDNLYREYTSNDMYYIEPTKHNVWGGFPMYFTHEPHTYSYRQSYVKPRLDYDAARAEILPAYKVLFDLIAPTINEYKAKMRVRKDAIQTIKRYTKSIQKAELARTRVYNHYERNIKEYRVELEKAKKILEENGGATL